MARAIDPELLQLLENKLGKEGARKLAEAIESRLEVMEKRAEELALQKKVELKDELTKELASKADLLVLKKELQSIIESGDGKLEKEILKLEHKLDLRFYILMFLIIISDIIPTLFGTNKGVLELLLKVWRLIR